MNRTDTNDVEVTMGRPVKKDVICGIVLDKKRRVSKVKVTIIIMT